MSSEEAVIDRKYHATDKHVKRFIDLLWTDTIFPFIEAAKVPITHRNWETFDVVYNNLLERIFALKTTFRLKIGNDTMDYWILDMLFQGLSNVAVLTKVETYKHAGQKVEGFLRFILPTFKPKYTVLHDVLYTKRNIGLTKSILELIALNTLGTGWIEVLSTLDMYNDTVTTMYCDYLRAMDVSLVNMERILVEGIDEDTEEAFDEEDISSMEEYFELRKKDIEKVEAMAKNKTQVTRCRADAE